MPELLGLEKTKGSVGRVVQMSVAQPRDCWLEPYIGFDNNDSSYSTSIGWHQEVNLGVIYTICDNLFFLNKYVKAKNKRGYIKQ